jgi:hypothetical protein
LTKAVKPELETSIFWCLQGFFPNCLKKETHCCLEQRKGEGDTHPELLRKGEEEAEDWGKREFTGSMHEGLLVTLMSRSVLPKDSTGALDERGELNSQAMETMKEV